MVECRKYTQKKIQIVQNKFLKLILNVPKRYRTARLHSKTKIDLIDNQVFQYHTRYKNKLQFVENHLIQGLEC